MKAYPLTLPTLSCMWIKEFMTNKFELWSYCILNLDNKITLVIKKKTFKILDKMYLKMPKYTKID